MNEITTAGILKEAGIPENMQRLCFDFFILYSRFEYALKRSGYIFDKEEVKVCLDKAGIALTPACENSIKKLRDEGLYIFFNPPKKQVNNKGTFEWSDKNTESMTETRRALHLASYVRNNLFHGGKWPNGPEYDIARDEKLIIGAITLIKTILNSNSKLKQIFLEFS
jgi:hypothetical protein